MSPLATPEMEIPLAIKPPELEAGDFIDDRFRIGSQFGEGGQSTVYSALDYETGDKVAFKVPVTSNDENAPRVLREVILTEAFSSETNDVVNFVAANVSEDKERPFIYLATNYMEGGSLNEKMRAAKWGSLPVEQVVAAVSPAANAAALMHDAELLHRDIKPGNIFLDKNGKGRLGDFGNAGAESLEPEALDYYHISPDVVSESLTATGSVHGSVGYAPPEAFVYGNGFNKASDTFSVGASLHRALTGKSLPYIPTRKDWNQEEGFGPALKDYADFYDAPRLWELPKDVPADLGMLAVSCLERTPEMRPTMRQVANELGSIAAQYN